MWKTPGEGDGVRGDSADLDIDIDMVRYVHIDIISQLTRSVGATGGRTTATV